MMIRSLCLAGTVLLVAACGSETPAVTDPVETAAEDYPEDDLPEQESTGIDEDETSGDLVSPEMDPVDRVEDTCGLGALQQYVGVNASEIPEDQLPEEARIVGPDTQVTMDYVPTRINVLTDGDGVVIGLKCG